MREDPRGKSEEDLGNALGILEFTIHKLREQIPTLEIVIATAVPSIRDDGSAGAAMGVLMGANVPGNYLLAAQLAEVMRLIAIGRGVKDDWLKHCIEMGALKGPQIAKAYLDMMAEADRDPDKN